MPKDLPDGWVQYTDPATNKPYYYDTKTKKTHWQLPQQPISQIALAAQVQQYAQQMQYQMQSQLQLMQYTQLTELVQRQQQGGLSLDEQQEVSKQIFEFNQHIQQLQDQIVTQTTSLEYHNQIAEAMSQGLLPPLNAPVWTSSKTGDIRPGRPAKNTNTSRPDNRDSAVTPQELNPLHRRSNEGAQTQLTVKEREILLKPWVHIFGCDTSDLEGVKKTLSKYGRVVHIESVEGATGEALALFTCLNDAKTACFELGQPAKGAGTLRARLRAGCYGETSHKDGEECFRKLLVVGLHSNAEREKSKTITLLEEGRGKVIELRFELVGPYSGGRKSARVLYASKEEGYRALLSLHRSGLVAYPYGSTAQQASLNYEDLEDNECWLSISGFSDGSTSIAAVALAARVTHINMLSYIEMVDGGTRAIVCVAELEMAYMLLKGLHGQPGENGPFTVEFINRPSSPELDKEIAPPRHLMVLQGPPHFPGQKLKELLLHVGPLVEFREMGPNAYGARFASSAAVKDALEILQEHPDFQTAVVGLAKTVIDPLARLYQVGVQNISTNATFDTFAQFLNETPLQTILCDGKKALSLRGEGEALYGVLQFKSELGAIRGAEYINTLSFLGEQLRAVPLSNPTVVVTLSGILRTVGTEAILKAFPTSIDSTAVAVHEWEKIAPGPQEGKKRVKCASVFIQRPENLAADVAALLSGDSSIGGQHFDIDTSPLERDLWRKGPYFNVLPRKELVTFNP